MKTLMPLLLTALLLTGCARYDFRIVEPQSLSQTITAVQTRITTENMRYDMIAKENRLVMLATNPAGQPVELLGAKSYVVDPVGASHPLRSQTIPPNSYMKLILPPLRPRFEQQNPQFMFGVGTQTSQAPASSTAPLRLDIYEDVNNYYWDWDGSAPIRLSLTYQRVDGSTFTDSFMIDKVEAK